MLKAGCVVAVIAGLAGMAKADSLKCPKSGKYVEVGDSAAAVEAKCGPPDSREPAFGTVCWKSGCARRRVGEFWRYDLGYTNLVRILLVQNGFVASIETGGYGKKST